MVAMVLGCGAVAWTVGEPIEVALAFLFCCVSWLGIAILICCSFGQLLQCSLNSIRNRDVRLIVGRYRWFYVDGVWIVWSVFVLVIMNYVIDHSVAGAATAINYGWRIWLIAIAVGIIIRILKLNWQGELPS